MKPLAAFDAADVIVMGIDPGLTTGWFLYRPDGLAALGRPQLTHLAGQTAGRHAFYRDFDTIVGAGAPLIVVIEKFTINAVTAKNSPQYDPLYIIGAVDRQCEKLGIPFHCQTPSEAKSFADDAKLKSVGWHTPGLDHGNDAARHVLRHVVTKRRELGGEELLKQIVASL